MDSQEPKNAGVPDTVPMSLNARVSQVVQEKRVLLRCYEGYGALTEVKKAETDADVRDEVGGVVHWCACIVQPVLANLRRCPQHR